MKTIFNSIVGTIFGLLIFIFLLFIIGGIWTASLTSKQKPNIKANSVLKASFSGAITERAVDDPLAMLRSGDLEGNGSAGLDEILKSIEAAKTDDKIKGVYLEMSGVQAGYATTDAIRHALLDFKESGKFIVAYAEGMTQKAYYLASVADEIYLNPSGGLILKGFQAKLPFLKGTLEKLEIEPEIYYAGKFKSATEPLRYKQMSDENREQILEYLGDFYDEFVEDISAERPFTAAEFETMINEFKVKWPQDALDNKVVDGLMYVSEVYDLLNTKLGAESDEKINFVSVGTYADAIESPEGEYKKDKIAVVYAHGGIVDGQGEMDEIGSARFVKILRKVRNDDKVKAVVLRVNSGGGSALASDVMHKEIELIKAAGKPVVTSMGDLAASGGYFIACNSDYILAEETTITGSIGVFGVLMDASKFYENKLGITFDEAKVNPYADMPTGGGLLTEGLDENEAELIQSYIDGVYDQFLSRVADGRDMEKAAVHEIAQGRVWTGKDALNNGLVDEIGGIQQAVDKAAELAGLDEYRTSGYPRQLDPIQQIMNKLQGVEEAKIKTYLQDKLGVNYQLLQEVEYLKNLEGPQMRLPFSIIIE